MPPLPRPDTRILLLFLSVLLGLAAFFGISVLREHRATTLVREGRIPKVLGTDPQRGSADAPIRIIEYGDFECPFCRLTQPIMNQIMTKYAGTVRHVWKDFPITGLHANAKNAAKAARCAQEQNAFWQMHDALFANQTRFADTLYPELAREIGLDATAFASCMEQERAARLVEESSASGVQAGVTSTPYFFINTIEVRDVPDQGALERAIEQALQSTNTR